MIYTNCASLLPLASYCYNVLGLKGAIHIEVADIDTDGYCYEDGLIEISNKLKNKGIALCHEMVHCYQYQNNGYADEEEAYRLETKLYHKEYNDIRRV
jgi:hypothetical protein